MADGDTINLAAGTFAWTKTITCGYFVTKTITITGAGKGQTVLDAQSARTHIFMGKGCNLVLRDLTLANGRSSGNGHGQYGGAIRAFSDTTIDATNVEFKNNEATNLSGSGGAVYLASCTATFTDCSFTSNKAGGSGGAVFLTSASATFTGCTFKDNYAPNSGGAVCIWHSAPSPVTFKSGNTFTGNKVVHHGPTLSSYWGAKAVIESGNSFGGGCFTWDGGTIEGSCS